MQPFAGSPPQQANVAAAGGDQELDSATEGVTAAAVATPLNSVVVGEQDCDDERSASSRTTVKASNVLVPHPNVVSPQPTTTATTTAHRGGSEVGHRPYSNAPTTADGRPPATAEDRARAVREENNQLRLENMQLQLESSQQRREHERQLEQQLDQQRLLWAECNRQVEEIRNLEVGVAFHTDETERALAWSELQQRTQELHGFLDRRFQTPIRPATPREPILRFLVAPCPYSVIGGCRAGRGGDDHGNDDESCCGGDGGRWCRGHGSASGGGGGSV
jgi:hypothetical protein